MTSFLKSGWSSWRADMARQVSFNANILIYSDLWSPGGIPSHFDTRIRSCFAMLTSSFPHAARSLIDDERSQSSMTCMARVHGMERGSKMLSCRCGKLPDCGQSGSFGLGHATRRIRSGLLVRHTFHQSARFLIGADRGDVQNRFAVMGLYQALAVVHSNEAIHFPVSVVGQLVLLPKLQRQRSNETSAHKVGQAIGLTRHRAPARTCGGPYLSNLDGYCRRTFRVLVHARAKKLC